MLDSGKVQILRIQFLPIMFIRIHDFESFINSKWVPDMISAKIKRHVFYGNIKKHEFMNY